MFQHTTDDNTFDKYNNTQITYCIFYSYNRYIFVKEHLAAQQKIQDNIL